MSETQKLVMVSYLNSKPFEFGLKNCDSGYMYDIEMATPSKCAEIFSRGDAEIALIPVGALHDLTGYKVISDYCIGCDGEVRTVCIFSNQKLENCNRLLLDNHSRTSFLLSRLILSDYLHINLPYQSYNINNLTYQDDDAVLMIGDKVFEYENKFEFRYDLGTLWKEWTGLPFVFAVWVSRMGLKAEDENMLNIAFKYGIEHLPEIIESESSESLDLYYYFHHHIRYDFDDKKKKALNLFLQKSKNLLQREGLTL